MTHQYFTPQLQCFGSSRSAPELVRESHRATSNSPRDDDEARYGGRHPRDNDVEFDDEPAGVEDDELSLEPDVLPVDEDEMR